jgi:hypothetical protein
VPQHAGAGIRAYQPADGPREAHRRHADSGHRRIGCGADKETGQEHRARIDLPNGFEYKIAEMANSVHWKATAGPKLELEHRNSYAHLCEIDWSNG